MRYDELVDEEGADGGGGQLDQQGGNVGRQVRVRERKSGRLQLTQLRTRTSRTKRILDVAGASSCRQRRFLHRPWTVSPTSKKTTYIDTRKETSPVSRVAHNLRSLLHFDIVKDEGALTGSLLVYRSQPGDLLR